MYIVYWRSFLLLWMLRFYTGGTKRHQVQQGDLDFPSPEWDSISTEAKDFITHLLQRDPAARMSATQSINHSWFDKPSGSATGDDATAPAAEGEGQVGLGVAGLRGVCARLLSCAGLGVECHPGGSRQPLKLFLVLREKLR